MRSQLPRESEGWVVWAFRLRDRRAVVAAVALAAALILWGTFDIVIEYDVDRAALFTLPWGGEAGQVGSVAVGDRIFGPRSFAVAGDEIYIADTFNRRVLVVDWTGEQLRVISLTPPPEPVTDSALVPSAVLPDQPRSLPASAEDDAGDAGATYGGPWINDIAVTGDRRLLLADALVPRILAIDANGELSSQIAVDAAAPGHDPEGDAAWLMERIAPARDGIIYLTHAYLSDAVLARRISRLSEADAKLAHLAGTSLREDGRPVADQEGLLPVPANSFAVGHDGSLYVEAAGPNVFTRVVRAYDEAVRPVGSWRVTRSQPITSAEVVGSDRWGHIYLALQPGVEDGKIVVLTKAAGELLELAPNWYPGYEANVFVRLVGDGAVVAKPSPDGWTLEHWRLRRQRGIRRTGAGW